MRILFIAFRAVIYATLFVLFFGWLAQSVRKFDQSTGLALPAWSPPLGIIFMLVGVFLLLTCVTIFVVRGQGTPAPFDPPTKFVAVGPYKYVRNPIYLGGFILLSGFGLFEQSFAILILAIILLFPVHLLVVLIEEPSLQQRFGDSYLAYKKKVNRWIPKWNGAS